MHHDINSRFGNFSATYPVIIALAIFILHPVPAQAQNKRTFVQNNVLWQWLSSIPETATRKTVHSTRNLTSTTSVSLNSVDGSVCPGEEAEMISLINQERAKAGLPDLQVDATLVQLAETKSRDMVRYNYFGHYSDRFGTVYDQLDHAGIGYQIVAENLIAATNCVKALESENQSPAHRGNLQNPHFTRIGVGVVRGGPHGLMITQILIR